MDLKKIGDTSLTPLVHDNIFKIVQRIYEFQQKLIQKLDNRIDEWSVTQGIADIFISLKNDFKYYDEFINCFESSFKIIVDFSAKSKVFNSFLLRKNEEVSK